jgi:hypothetical protein
LPAAAGASVFFHGVFLYRQDDRTSFWLAGALRPSVRSTYALPGHKARPAGEALPFLTSELASHAFLLTPIPKGKNQTAAATAAAPVAQTLSQAQVQPPLAGAVTGGPAAGADTTPGNQGEQGRIDVAGVIMYEQETLTAEERLVPWGIDVGECWQLAWLLGDSSRL